MPATFRAEVSSAPGPLIRSDGRKPRLGPDATATAELARQVATGQLTVRIAEILPLERFQDAYAQLGRGGLHGKVVLTPKAAITRQIARSQPGHPPVGELGRSRIDEALHALPERMGEVQTSRSQGGHPARQVLVGDSSHHSSARSDSPLCSGTKGPNSSSWMLSGSRKTMTDP
jgi:hypothetical protein